jgi:hypothetical protein
VVYQQGPISAKNPFLKVGMYLSEEEMQLIPHYSGWLRHFLQQGRNCL